jgi:hypothetical protein
MSLFHLCKSCCHSPSARRSPSTPGLAQDPSLSGPLHLFYDASLSTSHVPQKQEHSFDTDFEVPGRVSAIMRQLRAMPDYETLFREFAESNIVAEGGRLQDARSLSMTHSGNYLAELATIPTLSNTQLRELELKYLQVRLCERSRPPAPRQQPTPLWQERAESRAVGGRPPEPPQRRPFRLGWRSPT